MMGRFHTNPLSFGCMRKLLPRFRANFLAELSAPPSVVAHDDCFEVLNNLANTYVAYRIWSNISIASHAILITAAPALSQMTAFKPNHHPLCEREQEWDVLAFSSLLMLVERHPMRVFRFPLCGGFTFLLAVCNRPSLSDRFCLLRVCGTPITHPLAFICASLLSAIFGFSHWFLSYRTVVRGGIGADTLVPSCLYHAQAQDAVLC